MRPLENFGKRARGWQGNVRNLVTVTAFVLVGWPTLYLLILLGRVLLGWVGPIVGGQWIATVELGLDCAILAATGWVVGRIARPRSVLAVLLFAVTLLFWDLSTLIAINVPWLVRLIWHAVRGESAYWDSLITAGVGHILLFGSLIAGGLLSRPSTKPVSIVT